MTEPTWHERTLAAPGGDILTLRYRMEEGTDATQHEGKVLPVVKCSALEVYHPEASEWREVRNLDSRDWFVLGILAGRQEREGGQRELGL